MSNLKFDVVQTAGTINVDFNSIKAQLSEKMSEYNGLVFTEKRGKSRFGRTQKVQKICQ